MWCCQGNISHMTRIDYKKFPYFVRLIFALLVQLSKKTRLKLALNTTRPGNLEHVECFIYLMTTHNEI